MIRNAKARFKSLIAFLIYLGLLLSPIPTFSASIEIKFAHTKADRSPIGQGANLFKKRAEDQLLGKVIVKVYPASQLGNVIKISESLRNGSIQMAVLPVSFFTKFEKEYRVFELSFLFEDLGAVTRFQNSQDGKKLLTVIEKHRYKGLAFWHYGMMQLAANRQIRLPSDAKNLKIRMFQSKILFAEANAIGIKPIYVPPGAVFAALMKGSLDGVESTWLDIDRAKLYQVQKYISATDHRYLGYLLVANKNFWNKLPLNIQNKLNAIVREITKTVNKIVVEDSYEAANKINKSGTRILLLKAAERNKWRKSLEPVWSKFEKEIGIEIVNAAYKSGTGGGGDPCKIGECRCKDRTCEKECCY